VKLSTFSHIFLMMMNVYVPNLINVLIKSCLTVISCIINQNYKVCGFLLTRPSYQGVMCSSADLREIVTLCHSKGVPVIVDEAHGSHLCFLERPELGG
jgi:arginine/lysine/ornithine decarboxylase